METYTLVVLVALFLAVMGIIAMLEHRRRTELAHFEKLHGALVQIADALSQLRIAVETGTKSSSDTVQATTKAVKDLQASMEASVNFTK